MPSVRQRVNFIAAKFEPRIATALQAAFSNIKSQWTLKQIEELLTTGGVSTVLALLNTMNDQIASDIVPELNAAVSESGRISIGLLPNGALVAPYAFNVLDPSVSSVVSAHNASLVREIGASTRQAIVQNIRANIIAGNNPRRVARDFRDTLGLTAQQEQAVRNYRKMLIQKDKRALQARLRDKRFDSTVRQSVAGKKKLTSAQIDNMANRYRQRFLKYRSEVIARTEALRAISMGEFESLKQADDAGKIDKEVRRFWIYTKDERTRAEHRRIPSMNLGGVRIQEPFKTSLGLLMYPRDPAGSASNTIQCRCLLIYDYPEKEI